MMSALFKLTRPLLLLLAALTYTLGASIPAYLGRSFQPVVYALGLAGVLLAELSMALLAEVFRPHNEPLVENETPQQKEALRTNALYLSIAALSSSAFFVYLLYIDQALVASSIIFIVTSFVLVISYSIPPIRLVNRGFGELTLAAHIAYVVPSIGFLLQAKDNHRLLAVIIIPLTALALAYFIDRTRSCIFYCCQLYLLSYRPKI